MKQTIANWLHADNKGINILQENLLMPNHKHSEFFLHETLFRIAL